MQEAVTLDIDTGLPTKDETSESTLRNLFSSVSCTLGSCRFVAVKMFLSLLQIIDYYTIQRFYSKYNSQTIKPSQFRS